MARATRIVCLTRGVPAEELKEDGDYESLVQDITTECARYGPLINVVIPRPLVNGETRPGVGKAFLEYANVESASNARQGLNGRKLAGNEVVAVFFSETKFSAGDFDD